jgi:hypothetical protein
MERLKIFLAKCYVKCGHIRRDEAGMIRNGNGSSKMNFAVT